MDLGGVEKKVLGALLILSDRNFEANATLSQIANQMGYKKPGGALSFALKALEMQNHIAVIGKNKYKVLI